MSIMRKDTYRFTQRRFCPIWCVNIIVCIIYQDQYTKSLSSTLIIKLNMMLPMTKIGC